MSYVTTKEIAKLWGISNRRVNTLCNSNRISGAYKNGLMWLIPKNAKKPEDRRTLRNNMGLKDVETFEKLQNDYESELDKEYKKNNGIYYTPYDLIDLMYSELSISKEAVVVDPCCGMGGFLIGAIKNGFTNVYGADNDLKTVLYITDLLKSNKIIHFDSINNSAELTLQRLGIQKPDLIIGNPPYVPYGSLFGNLFVGSIIRSLDMVKENGIISYIIPKNFLHISTYTELRKTLLKDYTVLSIVDLGIYFKNVRGEQIVLTIKNAKPLDEHKFSIKQLKNGRFEEMLQVNQNLFQDIIRLFTSPEEVEVYKKMSSSYETLENYCTGYIGRGRSRATDAVSGKNLRKFGFKDRGIPKTGNKIFVQNIYSSESGIIGTFAGDLDAKETVTVITDTNPRICKYLTGILHSRLINYYLFKYCFNGSKLTAHTDKKYISQIPIVISKDSRFDEVIELVEELGYVEYLGDDWHANFEKLNNIVYEIYNLSEHEKKYIESSMRGIQSKRWHK